MAILERSNNKDCFIAMRLQRENTIFETNDQLCAYFSILKTNSYPPIRLYYRSSKPRRDIGYAMMPTRYMDSKDGIKFRKPKNDIILDYTASCHNFFPFIDTNPNPKTPYKYKALGGVQWRKKDPRFYGDEPNPNWRDRGCKTVEGYQGLYLLGSNDGIKWKKLKKTPVLTRHHKGFTTISDAHSDFDGAICCMFDHNTQMYKLWVRSNVAINRRFIQYAESKDLFKWSRFHLITTDPEFKIKNYDKRKKENYYYPSFYLHPDQKRYLGLLPYYNKTWGKLLLVISDNGSHWRVIDSFLSEKVFTKSTKTNKTKIHPVTGYILSEDGQKIYFYVQHNYFRYDNKRPMSIVRYSMDLQEIIDIK